MDTPVVSVIGAVLIGVIAAVVGALAGGGTALAYGNRFLTALNKDVALQTAIEKLGDSLPKDTIEKINQGGVDLQLLGEFIEKVTDGKANTPPAGG